jgi:hypothetical protein
MDWIWIIIPVVAILGSYFLSYQKMKMKQLKQGTHQDLEDMQTLINSLKKRIENLEAIAATDPNDPAAELETRSENPAGSKPGERPNARGGTLNNMLT